MTQPSNNPNANYLAIDYGGRRIGVAIASAAARLPRPLVIIDTHAGDPVAELQKLVAGHDVAVLVVGLPRGLDGQETGQTMAVREFVKSLQASVPCPVEFQDEAATTVVAKARGAGNGAVDAEAAAIILDDWLHGKGLV